MRFASRRIARFRMSAAAVEHLSSGEGRARRRRRPYAARFRTNLAHGDIVVVVQSSIGIRVVINAVVARRGVVVAVIIAQLVAFGAVCRVATRRPLLKSTFVTSMPGDRSWRSLPGSHSFEPGLGQ